MVFTHKDIDLGDVQQTPNLSGVCIMGRSNTVKKGEVVIRHSPLFVVLCVIFAILCVVAAVANVMSLLEGLASVGDALPRLVAAAFAIFGVPFFGFYALKPLAIVSAEGLSIPYGLKRKYEFISWHNIRKIEEVEQEVGIGASSTTVTHLGVFAWKSQDIKFVGSSKHSKKISKLLLGMKDAPDLIISTFTSGERKKIIAIMQSYRVK